MAKDLVVGSAGLQGFEDSVTRFLSSRGMHANLDAWLHDEVVAEISCLNGATVMEFLRHVVRLEGYEDESAGFNDGADGKLKGKNFPWWDNSLWLPVEFANPGPLDDDPTFFVGSCQRLIAELDDLRKISSLGLGEAVPAYAQMRTDMSAFLRSDSNMHLSGEDCVRWVWRALHDAAGLAIAHKAPVWMGPD